MMILSCLLTALVMGTASLGGKLGPAGVWGSERLQLHN